MLEREREKKTTQNDHFPVNWLTRFLSWNEKLKVLFLEQQLSE